MNKYRLTKNTLQILLIIVLTYSGLVTAKNNPKPSMPEINTDFDQKLVRKKFISYFKDKELGEKFDKKLATLSAKNQSYCLSLFNDAAQELGSETSRRNKHFLALSIYDAFELIERRNGGASGMVEIFFDEFPQFREHLVGISIYQLAQEADWSPGVSADFTPEQKAELAEIKKNSAEIKKNIAESKKNSAEIKKNIAESKKNIAEYNKLLGLSELIKEKNHKNDN